MRQNRPIPKELDLGATLARRVSQIREFRNLTIKDLARLSRFSFERIEDIEGGLETWLSVADRQVLAKALNVEPEMLLEVEARHHLDQRSAPSIEDEISTAILGGKRDIECPRCGNLLNCRIEQAFDIKANSFQIAKAFCLKCPYVIR